MKVWVAWVYLDSDQIIGIYASEEAATKAAEAERGHLTDVAVEEWEVQE